MCQRRHEEWRELEGCGSLACPCGRDTAEAAEKEGGSGRCTAHGENGEVEGVLDGGGTRRSGGSRASMAAARRPGQEVESQLIKGREGRRRRPSRCVQGGVSERKEKGGSSGRR